MKKQRFTAPVGIIVTLAAVVAALSGCEASQISWANHFFAVSRAGCAPVPLTVGGATLHNGAGVVGFTNIFLEKVYYGDLNHDGVQDAVVVLGCTDAGGGNSGATEIQIFTRDAKPIARLIQPDRYGSGNPFGSEFNLRSIGIRNNVLYTGAFGYLPSDAHCCPSAYDVYRWDWNGHGFTAVDIETNQ